MQVVISNSHMNQKLFAFIIIIIIIFIIIIIIIKVEY